METLTELIGRYPKLAGCRKEMEESAALLIRAFENGNRLYLCGNGGSAADADHIVGELMKGFLKKRPLSAARLAAFGADAEHIGARLAVGLPAISLHSQSALLTAFMNDEDPALVFAQALYALGERGDVLLAISTSGSSALVHLLLHRSVIACILILLLDIIRHLVDLLVGHKGSLDP